MDGLDSLSTRSGVPAPLVGETSKRVYVSSIDRLRELPGLFRGSDLTMRHGWNSKTASHYLWLWKKSGLAMPLGGHSDVFANLVVDPDPNWEAALLMARPSAVIVGIKCLQRAGWTTQIVTRPDVVIDSSLPVFRSNHFDVQRRSVDWFAAASRGLTRNGFGSAPAIKPAWALADMLQRSGWAGCGLAPNDIDWDVHQDSDHREWQRALRALGMPKQELKAPEVAESEVVQPTQIERCR